LLFTLEAIASLGQYGTSVEVNSPVWYYDCIWLHSQCVSCSQS